MDLNRVEIDKNMDISRYKFYNEPVACTLEDYETARDEFVHHISKDSGVISIYQIGNVGVYGISDLDFVVVLNKKIKFNQSYFSIKNFSEKTKYILSHEQYFVNEDAIKNLYQVTSVFDLLHIYGEEFEIAKLTGEELKYNTLILLNDICVVSLCYEYLNYIKSKKLDVRLLLARLNSLKYPIQMLSTLTGKSFPEFDKFIFNFKKYRENWFILDEIERKRKLICFLHMANGISKRLIKLILEYNVNQNIFEYHTIESDESKGYFNGEGTLINVYNFPALDNNLYQNNPVLDIFWGLHLKEYAKDSGVISNHIDSNLSVSQLYKPINDIYQKLQQKRISLLNNLAEFRDSMNLSFGGIFTFGYRKLNLSSKIRKNITNVLRLLRRNDL